MHTTSVLINNYNNGKFLAACIDSVLRQTVPADEVIVYDDGSTDESVEILRGYGDRIILLGAHDAARPSRENQANAVYRAFERASGDWIFLLDGDDLFMPEKIERVLWTLQRRDGISLVQSPLALIDAQGRTFGQYRDQRFHNLEIRSAIYEQNDVDFFYPTSAMVVSREALSLVLPLDMRVAPELACDTRIGMLMPLLGQVVTIDENLAGWRRHSGSYITAMGQTRWFPVQQTFRRVRTFNTTAIEFGARSLSLWKNRRLRRQIAGALLPKTIRQKLREGGAVLHAAHRARPKCLGA